MSTDGEGGERNSEAPMVPDDRPSVIRLPAEPVVLRGISGSPGIAVGPALVIGDMRAQYAQRHIHTAQIPSELARLEDAVTRATRTLRDVSAKVVGAKDAQPILEAYVLMLGDPMLHEVVRRKIKVEKKCAEWAVAEASDEIGAAFGDPRERDAYIVERRHDVAFVCERLLRSLLGEAPVSLSLDHPSIVVSHDLSPADTAGMVRGPVLGFVTAVGSRTSHTSIRARALEIPAVVGAPDALTHIRTGDMVVVDGLTGTVTVHPTMTMVVEAHQRSTAHLAFARRLLESKDQKGLLGCGTPIALKANVELPAEATLAVDHGAEGIGLYRTEFLDIDRSSLPTEDEQYEIYRAVVHAVGGRPVTLRTFDIGGDKFASTFQLPAEMNPALGLRAIRLALRQPDVFATHLRAMVRASAHGEVRIMIPMVTTLREMREVRDHLAAATADVRARGLPCADHIALGMMVEVPAAAIMADLFAKEADFFSVGTNDLVQYALAIDRTSQSLAELASAFSPAILRLIRSVTRAARANDVPVALCGAMASEPLAALLLVGLGLRELSMEATAIPEIKESLRRFTLAELEPVAERALMSASAEEVQREVHDAFAPRLVDLLSFSQVGSAILPVGP